MKNAHWVLRSGFLSPGTHFLNRALKSDNCVEPLRPTRREEHADEDVRGGERVMGLRLFALTPA